jgi:60S ribosome subunit biogenesis protein NIP7
MRPLLKEELETFFSKLSKYLGSNIQRLIKRDDEPHCFRLHKDRVYYVSEALMRQATNIGRDELLLLGTCFGKFTKSGKFRLHITCLDHMAQHAKYKVWVKPNAEMSFLYGNHVPRAGLARITENTPQYAGVVVYNMANVPLGFGLASHATEMCRALEPTAHVVLRQADIGEYLREEETLT